MGSERPIHRERQPAAVAARPVSLEDAQLIERIRTGQTEAYGLLVRKYQDQVFNTCWRICGHLEDARDVSQEAFLKAYEKLPAFRQESGFYTWIFRIAVNLALSKRREVSRRRTVSLDEGGAALGEQARQLLRQTSAKSDRASDEEGDLHGCLARAIQELEPDYRAVIVLRDIEGMDYQTVAEILEIPAGTVKSRLHRARVMLSTALRPSKTRRE